MNVNSINFDSPDWPIYDRESASFSLRNWRISVNEEPDALERLVTEPQIPRDIRLLSVLSHEYHHWLSSFCSTYGLFINVCRYIVANEAANLVAILSAHCEFRKPIIQSLKRNINRYITAEQIKQYIDHYLTMRKMVELLIGTRSAPYSLFRDLAQ